MAPAPHQRRPAAGIAVEILHYDPERVDRFRAHAMGIRSALGDPSTASVPPRSRPSRQTDVDIQLSVIDFEAFDPLRMALSGLGWRSHPDNSDRRKRHFTLDEGPIRRSNLHRRDEFRDQAALLFRRSVLLS